MDPFTQRMLEKAEQRSRALGITNASKFPLTECNTNNAGGDGNVNAALTAQWQQPKLQQQQQRSEQQLQLQRSPAQPSTHTLTTTNAGHSSKQIQVVEKMPMDAGSATGGCGVSPNKVLRQFSALNKENMEMGIEINIMMDKNVEVEVHVEEQDTTDGEDEARKIREEPDKCSGEAANQPLAKLRDTSRNRLQRLGALYSKPEDLSSPIHRTEAQFTAEDAGDADEDKPKRPKQRYGKLAALANSINQWENDTAHHTATVPTTTASSVPPPKPDLPSRRLVPHQQHQQQKQQSPEPQHHSTTTISAPLKLYQSKTANLNTATAAPTCNSNDDDVSQNKTKQLKWDPKVINSLEAQGFQRRESNTAKLAYDYAAAQEGTNEDEPEQEAKESHDEKQLTVVLKKPVGKLTPSEVFNAAQGEKKALAPAEKVSPPVKTGLVSGRAAAFEHKAAAAMSQPQRPQKDPTELSLKERMQLFENNKGDALLPKAAFGMAPPINKIRSECVTKKEAPKAPSSSTLSSSVPNKPLANDSNVRGRVAALVASTSTISENKIIADIHKQRQEDMQILANRFNKQKDAFTPKEQIEQPPLPKQKELSKSVASTASVSGSSPKKGSNFKRPPPPPPPPQQQQQPTQNLTPSGNSILTSKRRSPGDLIDDETKRARKTHNDGVDAVSSNARIYPVLSDLESNESYNCCTTATPVQSDCNTWNDEGVDEKEDRKEDLKDPDQDDNSCHDSYMDSEDEGSVGFGNNSLGREVLHVVQKKDHQQQQQQQQQRHNQSISKQTKEVRYAERDYYYGDSSLNSSEASMGVDDYLDEALVERNEDDDGDDDCTQESEDDEKDTSRVSRGSKGTTASNSFSFRKTPKRFSNCQTISEEQDDYQTPTTSSNTFTISRPVTSELSVNQEDDNMVTLVHTVSFYRKQQTANSNNSTPVRRICREQQVLRSTPLNGESNPTITTEQFEPQQQQQHHHHHHEQQQQQTDDNLSESEDSRSDEEAVDNSYRVQEKMKKLLDEVCKQQQVIGQISQALNLCAATIEFSGSTESVEGERHLLVATHRRQSCLDEVQRLRVEKSLRPLGAPKEKGRLTVKEITLPLRQDYIRKLAADTISGHHLVCLLKYNEHVLATKTVPTLPGLLAVKFPDVLQLNNVYADFRVTLEIYGMTAQREVLPHEVKYHINLNKKSGIKTPKKKGGDNRLVMPPVQSPAGPHIVRTPALVQYAFAIFSLRETQRTTWTLTQVLGVSPLDGAVHMKVNCELSVSVEHKGFLTMFEDISGFGAWHRRWCYLSGTMLNFWKYPDDEKKKTPMGSIDLYACITQRVTTAPRDICARLNTILLECERPALETDRESLIVVPNGRTTTVRHLLSADTKEEREEWCAYFNKALTLLRAWGPPQ